VSVDMRSGMFTSINGCAETPQDLFDQLHAEFGFTLDAAAEDATAKCPRYFTPENDAFKQPWTGRVWLNPPYGRTIGKWIKKAYDEVQSGNSEIAVLLVPARTDTKWWHEYCMRGEIRFIQGRLRFKGYGPNGCAPFPSAIVIFRRNN